MTTRMGEKIKLLRKRKGLSQEALAQILGVSFQSVSKWETGTTFPDITLIPSIAAFFNTTTDELFQYNVLENERKAEDICRAAAKLRNTDPAHAEKLLREGLAQFPANEALLTVLLYTLLSMKGREEDILRTGTELVEYGQNEGVRIDVLRILAETYATIGKQDLAEITLDRIPEFYFTKMECAARLLQGERQLDAARFQMNLSASSTVEMLHIMADIHQDEEMAARCRRIASGILDVYQREGGTALEFPGYEWIQSAHNSLKSTVS